MRLQLVLLLYISCFLGEIEEAPAGKGLGAIHQSDWISGSSAHFPPLRPASQPEGLVAQLE
jgi:hypothetical protein